MVHLGLAVLAAVALLVSPSSAGAAPPPGFDFFETDPESTQFTFRTGGTVVSPSLVGPDGLVGGAGAGPTLAIPGTGTAIPPGFFGPGSDPFVGEVHLGGVPLGAFQGRRIGDADTVVQRHEPTPFDSAGEAPIELIRLSLQSVDPIVVTYNGGRRPERWDMGVSPSPASQSRGTIAIREDGTFDSRLFVVPLLTFTRVSDGLRRSLDMAPLAQQVGDALIFRQDNAPWRNGCVQPALAVPGLNDGFCPGFTPKGAKVLTVEQAALASHGIYPAQRSLEHFHCYSLGRAPFSARVVALRDQFGIRKAKIARRRELCNPVRKNREPFVNKRAHLQCYATSGPSLDKLVAVRNQFGSQRLLVEKPRRLCLPSEKQIFSLGAFPKFPRIRTRIDHFQCYAIKGRSPVLAVKTIRRVKLHDQFGGRGARVGPAFQLCAPVQKWWKGQTRRIHHPVKHLVCYRLDPRRVSRLVRIRNQFERRLVRTRYSGSLCVPSNKLVLR